MNFDKYLSTMNYPIKTAKPYMPKDFTSGEVREYADKFAKWKKDLTKYTEKIAEYREDQRNKYELFKQDLFEELEITNNPKKEKLFAIAWEYGHSSGLEEVYNYAIDLVELIR